VNCCICYHCVVIRVLVDLADIFMNNLLLCKAPVILMGVYYMYACFLFLFSLVVVFIKMCTEYNKNKQVLCMCLKSKSLCFVLTSKRNKCLVTEFLKKGKIPLNFCQLECHSSITSCLLTQKLLVEVRDFSAIFFFSVYHCWLSTCRMNILVHLCTILTAVYLHIWLPHGGEINRSKIK